jgi:hypothetical protein
MYYTTGYMYTHQIFNSILRYQYTININMIFTTEASRSKKDVRPCTCLCIDSIFTWIVTRPCDSAFKFRTKHQMTRNGWICWTIHRLAWLFCAKENNYMLICAEYHIYVYCVWFNSQDLILFQKYHDLPSTTSCEHAAVVFVRNSPEYTTPYTQSESKKKFWFNSQDLILFQKYHDLPSTTSCEYAVVIFVRNLPEYRRDIVTLPSGPSVTSLWTF